MDTGSFVRQCLGHSSWVRTLLFESTKQYLWSGGDEGVLRIWDIRNAEVGESRHEITAHNKGVMTLTLVQNAKIWTGGGDGVIKVWDLSGQPQNAFQAHKGWVSSMIVVADMIWTGSTDKTIRIWSEAGKCLRTFNVGSYVGCIHRWESRVWVSAADKSIRVYRISNSKLLQRIQANEEAQLRDAQRKQMELQDALQRQREADQQRLFLERESEYLSRIQGYQEKLREQERENKHLRDRIAELEAIILELRAEIADLRGRLAKEEANNENLTLLIADLQNQTAADDDLLLSGNSSALDRFVEMEENFEEMRADYERKLQQARIELQNLQAQYLAAQQEQDDHGDVLLQLQLAKQEQERLSVEHQAELQSMQTSAHEVFQRRLREFQHEFQASQAQLVQEHQTHLEQLRVEHQQQLDALRAQQNTLQTSSKASEEALSLKHNAQITALEKQLADLKQALAQQLANHAQQDFQHQAHIKDLQAQHQAQLAQLQLQFDQQQSLLEQQRTSELARSQQLESLEQQLDGKHSSQALLQKQYEELLARFQQSQSDHQQEISALKANLQESQTHLASLQQQSSEQLSDKERHALETLQQWKDSQAQLHQVTQDFQTYQSQASSEISSLKEQLLQQQNLQQELSRNSQEDIAALQDTQEKLQTIELRNSSLLDQHRQTLAEFDQWKSEHRAELDHSLQLNQSLKQTVARLQEQLEEALQNSAQVIQLSDHQLEVERLSQLLLSSDNDLLSVRSQYHELHSKHKQDLIDAQTKMRDLEETHRQQLLAAVQDVKLQLAKQYEQEILQHSLAVQETEDRLTKKISDLCSEHQNQLRTQKLQLDDTYRDTMEDLKSSLLQHKTQLKLLGENFQNLSKWLLKGMEFPADREIPSIIKVGFMLKKGDRVKNWKRRLFVLCSDGDVAYYAHKDCPRPRGTISLRELSEIKHSQGTAEVPDSMDLHTSNRVWSLHFDTNTEEQAWASIINAFYQKRVSARFSARV